MALLFHNSKPLFMLKPLSISKNFNLPIKFALMPKFLTKNALLFHNKKPNFQQKQP